MLLDVEMGSSAVASCRSALQFVLSALFKIP